MGHVNQPPIFASSRPIVVKSQNQKKSFFFNIESIVFYDPSEKTQLVVVYFDQQTAVQIC